MLDQDTAHALTIIATETGARLALAGDRHQVPAGGRGGVLDLAARWASPEARITVDNVHRFSDPDYAKLSLAMRRGDNPEAMFDQLAARGQIAHYPDETSRTAALADEAAVTGALGVADTREQAAHLNQAIRERHVTAGRVDDTRAIVTNGGERICIGDRVATRSNDYDLGAANRGTWMVTAIRDNGTLQLTGKANTREVPRTRPGWLIPVAAIARNATVRRRVPRHRVGGRCQGRPEDARPRVSDHDAGHPLAPVRGSSRRGIGGHGHRPVSGARQAQKGPPNSRRCRSA